MTTTMEHDPRPATAKRRGLTGEERVGLVKVAVGALAVGSVFALLGWLGPLLVMLLAIPVSIGLHEAGHLLAAKATGMKVTEYFIGFGPRLWSIRRGETEYGLKAIPAGGYCKIVGMNNLEDVDPVDEPRTYRQKSYPRRVFSVVAGVAMNFLFAALLLWILFALVGVATPVDGRLEIGGLTALETGPSPAQEAGLRPGDEVVAVDGRVMGQDELAPYIRRRPGQPVVFTIDREGRRLDLTVTPTDLSKVRIEGEGPVADSPTGFAGIRFGQATEQVRVNPVAAVPRAVGEVGRTVKLVVGALGNLFSPDGLRGYIDQFSGSGPVQVTPDSEPAPRLLTPVGLVGVADQASDDGLASALYLVISINVFVAVFNLVPLLPLDGGHIAVATYERIRSRGGRRHMVDAAKLMPLTVAVLGIIVVLGVTALYLDIARPLRF